MKLMHEMRDKLQKKDCMDLNVDAWVNRIMDTFYTVHSQFMTNYHIQYKAALVL